ncbi:hypothetical protein [Lewinella sp. W8]|uniref:hypothetical protein n=1 Tax=Lewinella sp. W8 TaxID=2528208 RepID=UPI0010675A11|nr:hypothetical protein [Lewinella sp. W8]MTB49661.1 hypothetical protein [Lewinella sp. W8]
MKERNYDKLRRALDQLPDHQPPADCWRGIERELVGSLGDRLPSYRPPASVWNHLNQELDQGIPQSIHRARRRSLRWVAVAASFLLVLALAGNWWAQRNAGPTVTVAISSEPMPTATLVKDWDDEEQSFTEIIEEIDRRDEPTLNNLRYELDELTSAKEEIQAMLVAYGDDPTVVRQLAEIERDRSDLYRRIIVEL